MNGKYLASMKQSIAIMIFLLITRNIGELKVETKEGKGSELIIQFPVV
jgi:hypothetical protein